MYLQWNLHLGRKNFTYLQDAVEPGTCLDIAGLLTFFLTLGNSHGYYFHHGDGGWVIVKIEFTIQTNKLWVISVFDIDALSELRKVTCEPLVWNTDILP